MRLRGRTYHADFQVGGRRIRRRLSSNLKTASQLLIELRARAERGEFDLLDNDMAVDDLRKQWLRHCQQSLKASSAERYEQVLDAILPAFPAKVSQFTVQAVLDHRQKRLAAEISPGTINMEVGILGIMLRWAVTHRLIGSNPLAGIKPLPHDQKKEGRALDPAEVARLLATAPPIWRDVWYAFLVTGLRCNELASLRFSDIDWENRELVVQRGIAKNHNARRIPIEDGLWEILRRQRDRREDRRPGQAPSHGSKIDAIVRLRFTTEHVFTTGAWTVLTQRVMLKELIRHCRKAGIQTETRDPQGNVVEHVDLHGLRRTFATTLIVNGADPKTVQELLGHKTLQMTMAIYTKINSQTKRQALGRLSYGSGVRGPEHVISLPERRLECHNGVTSPAKSSQAIGG
jgi:integrase